MQRRLAFKLFVAAAMGGTAIALRGEESTASNHVAWAAEFLKRMQAIQPGMIRAALDGAFTTEGGLSTRPRRTFVSRDCPYFKVDVEFRAVAEMENGNDIVAAISKPYLEFQVAD
jgi:hypothetical protein